MEQNSQNLFGLELDQQAQNYLSETARWSKFLAIVWFIICGLTVLFFIIMMVALSGDLGSTDAQVQALESLTGFIMILVLIAIEVVPNIFRLNFANKMIRALRISDQQLLNEAFGQLRLFNRYWGIVTIIIVAVYAISFVLLLIGLLTRF